MQTPSRQYGVEWGAMSDYPRGRGKWLGPPMALDLSLSLQLSMIACTVTALTYFLRSGRGGNPHAVTDRKTSVSFIHLSPQWQADADDSGGRLFQNGCLAPKIPVGRLSRVEFPCIAECCPCETAASTLRNVPFEGL
jgi:hypothetical protein